MASIDHMERLAGNPECFVSIYRTILEERLRSLELARDDKRRRREIQESAVLIGAGAEMIL
jgi:hypothetical protein